MSACRSCGAPIKWARTPKGRRIPLDPDPVPDGNIVLRGGVAHVDGPAAGGFFDDGAGERYVSHFATCPNARSHRRPR